MKLNLKMMMVPTCSIKNAKAFVEFRKVIIQALEDRYNAQISEAEAILKIYLETRAARARCQVSK